MSGAQHPSVDGALQSSTLTRDEITVAIVEVKNDWLSRGYSEFGINDGSCEEFAQTVVDTLRDMGRNIDDLEIHDISSFVDEDEGWDIPLLETHWRGIKSPNGLGWNDVQLVSDAAHVFLVHEGRFYDSDSPEGVENLFDLPLMRRNPVGELRSRRSTRHVLMDLVKADPWWAESMRMWKDLKVWVDNGRPGGSFNDATLSP